MITAVGLNSQTGIIMSLLGATKEDKKDDKSNKVEMNGNGKCTYDAAAVPVILFAHPGHPATLTVANGLSNGDKKKEEEAIVPVEDENKGKSVLQAKLSNLAIQIGYIGGFWGFLWKYDYFAYGIDH